MNNNFNPMTGRPIQNQQPMQQQMCNQPQNNYQ